MNRSSIKIRFKKVLVALYRIVEQGILSPLNSILPWMFDEVFFRKTTIKINGGGNVKRIRYRDFGKETRSRAKSSLTKEPNTIIWINSFNKGQRLLDVGANMGVFTLYAAVTKECHVVALEPCAPSYCLLNLNIYENNVGDRVIAYPLAAASKRDLVKLYMTELSHDSGGGLPNSPVDARGDKFIPKHVQGSASIEIDEIYLKHGPFHHVKIDTDGNEMDLLKGSAKLLASKDLQSILIELNENLEGYADIVSYIISFGFSLDEDLTSKSYVSTKRGGKIYNHIFKRNLVKPG